MNLDTLLTQREQSTLARFEVWLTKLLNAKGRILIKPIAYSTLAHPDLHGRVTIDSGRMVLSTPGLTGGPSYILKDSRTSDVIASSDTLVKVLLGGLHHAVNRHFVDHHPAD